MELERKKNEDADSEMVKRSTAAIDKQLEKLKDDTAKAKKEVERGEAEAKAKKKEEKAATATKKGKGESGHGGNEVKSGGDLEGDKVVFAGVSPGHLAGFDKPEAHGLPPFSGDGATDLYTSLGLKVRMRVVDYWQANAPFWQRLVKWVQSMGGDAYVDASQQQYGVSCGIVATSAVVS